MERQCEEYVLNIKKEKANNYEYLNSILFTFGTKLAFVIRIQSGSATQTYSLLKLYRLFRSKREPCKRFNCYYVKENHINFSNVRRADMR